MLDDLKKFIEGLQVFLDLLFGGKAPAFLLPTIGWIIAIGVILYGVIFSLGLIKKLWVDFIEPFFYNPEQRRRRFRRQMFTDHIEGEIRILNSKETWNDNRFTELEAHVEAEEERKSIFRFGGGQGSRIRLEKSLSTAIEHSTSRLVLLEGDPGSGKSVALRHVAQLMAAKAHKSRSLRFRIPLYINLKYLRRREEQTVDRNLIEDFVLQNINRVGDRDIDEYLHEEFKHGLQEDMWFFLFDSFDEIPEILSSTGTDDAIRKYAEAIRDFLHGMNQCRGILASREYKGPRFLGWPVLRVLPLTSSRRSELIKRTGLPTLIQVAISDGLALASSDFRMMASNPMFLNLICDYMNKEQSPEFPQHIHLVFEEYIQKRLSHDEERLKQKFNKSPQEIKIAAEKIAFCITSDYGLGLVPEIRELRQTTIKLDLGLGDDFDTFINALAYLKVGKVEISPDQEHQTFTFSHRRFQEYFATSIALRQPDRLSVQELITNARWRETAVVILQTQNEIKIKPILDAILINLSEIKKELGESFKNFSSPENYYDSELPKFEYGQLFKLRSEPFSISEQKIKKYLQATKNGLRKNEVIIFKRPEDWPKGLYHILSILQDGTIRKRFVLQGELQRIVDALLFYFSEAGNILDRKLCLDVAGCASNDLLSNLVKKGLKSNSVYMKDAAFKQLARLSEIGGEMKRLIIIFIGNLAIEGKLFQNRQDIAAQLSRLNNPGFYLEYLRFLLWTPVIEQVLLFLGLLLLIGLINLNIFLWCAFFIAFYFLILRLTSQFARILFVNTDIYLFVYLLYRVCLIYALAGVFLIGTIQHSSYEAINHPRFWIAVSFIGWGIIASLLSIPSKDEKDSKPAIRWFWWPLYSISIYLLFLIPNSMFVVWPWMPEIIKNVLYEIPIEILIGVGTLFGVYWLFFMLQDWIYLFSRRKLIVAEMKKNEFNFKHLRFVFSNSDNSAFLITTIAIALLSGFGMFLIISKVLGVTTLLSKALFIPIAFAFSIFGIYSIVVLWTGLFQSFAELVAYIKFARIRHTKYSITEMLQELDKFDNTFFRSLLIRSFISNQLIQATLENRTDLYNLIGFVDALLQSQNKKDQFLRLQDISPKISEWVKCPSPKNGLARLLYDWDFICSYAEKWNEPILDALCRLSEQMSEIDKVVSVSPITKAIAPAVPAFDQQIKTAMEMTKAGKLQESYAILKEVVKVDSNNAQVWLFLGIDLTSLKDYVNAERCLQRAKKLGDPKADAALE